MSDAVPIHQLRVVLNVEDLPAALAFYRDALGLPEAEAYSGPGDAQVVILEAGRATLELANPEQSDHIADVETGGAASTPVRLAFESMDTEATTTALAGTGAAVAAPPVRTPWDSLNARVIGPEGLHVTVFQELAGEPRAGERGTQVPGGPAEDRSASGAEDAPRSPGSPAGPSFGAELLGPVPDGGEAGLLRAAVDLARRNAEAGREPFGALAVHDGVVVGVGVNTGDAAWDPTAHAEVEAIRAAARALGRADLAGVTVYSSCEPCPVCRVVAAAANVSAVVAAIGKDALPPGVDRTAPDVADVVQSVRPGLVRRGDAGLPPEELSGVFSPRA